MEAVYWKTDSAEQTTNVSYNCVDRHMSNPDKKDDLALLWDGNFWDDDIHDYADLSWDVIEVLTQKIANIFNDYCEKGDHVLFLLHNVIQLPISLMAASRIGVVSVLLNPATSSTSQLAEVIRETQPKLVVAVDAFWQGHILLETKKDLDKAVEDAKVSSIKRILVIRHTAPNPGVPPPDVMYPGRRPCYEIKLELNEEIDVEWKDLVAKANTQCDPEWLHGDHPFAVLPKWNPSLQLRTITTRQILSSAAELAPLTVADCLSLAHPQTPLGLVGCVAVWLTGNVLAIFEGTLDHPDPSRLKQIIKKFEVLVVLLEMALAVTSNPELEQNTGSETPSMLKVSEKLKSAILPKCDLDPEYMAMVPVPSLTRIITEVGNSGEIARSFSDVDILEWDVEAALRGHE